MSKFIETEDSIVRTSDIVYITKCTEQEKNNIGAVVKIWYTIRIYLRNLQPYVLYSYSSEIERDKNYEAMVMLLKEEEK